MHLGLPTRPKKIRPKNSDGREENDIGHENSLYRSAPLPHHEEIPNEEEATIEERHIMDEMMPVSSSGNPRTGNHMLSAYMTRHNKAAHFMGLSPIEEMKLAQGEFQAKAATNLIDSHGRSSRLDISSVASSMTTMMHTSPTPRRKKSLAQKFVAKLKTAREETQSMQRSSSILPEDVRRISHALNKDIMAMTPEQALNFVQDASKSETILKQKSIEMRSKKTPWYLVHPAGLFRTRWDLINLFLLIYTAIFIPLQLAFESHMNMDLLAKIDVAGDGFFIADLLINCVSTYEVRGHIETRLRYLVTTYLKTWFFMDIIASFPYNILNYHLDEMNDNIRLLKLLRLSRLPRILNRLEYSLLVRSKVGSLIKFLFLVMMTSHFFSCGFYKYSYGSSDGWVAKFGLGDRTLYDKYITCFYWSIMTMTTVGYGDVTGQTTKERLWSIFAMLNGAWIFAYGITNVVSMVSNLNLSDTKFQLKMDYVNKYMDVRDLPIDLRSEIREFFINTRITVETKLKNESKILSELSALLRSKVALAINDSVLNKMPFFEGADHNFLMELALSMKMVCLPPHEEIIIEGEIGEEMFFIFRGAVEVLRGGVQVAVLGEQQYFGEMAILNQNCLRTATVMTLCFCELRMLTREKFLLALTHYPGMRHRIAKIVHRRNVEGSKKNLKDDGISRRSSTVVEKVQASMLEAKRVSERSFQDKRVTETNGKGPPMLASLKEGSQRHLHSFHASTDGLYQEGSMKPDNTMDRILQLSANKAEEVSNPCQDTKESVQHQILLLLESQETLAHHVLEIDEKWLQVQKCMRRMQRELNYYRDQFGVDHVPPECLKFIQEDGILPQSCHRGSTIHKDPSKVDICSTDDIKSSSEGVEYAAEFNQLLIDSTNTKRISMSENRVSFNIAS